MESAAALRSHRYLLLPPPSLAARAKFFHLTMASALGRFTRSGSRWWRFSYPVCLWYAKVKQRRRDLWWLSYL